MFARRTINDTLENYVDDEIMSSINEIRDEPNEDLVGFIMLDYRRNKPELVKRYPEYFF